MPTVLYSIHDLNKCDAENGTTAFSCALTCIVATAQTVAVLTYSLKRTIKSGHEVVLLTTELLSLSVVWHV